MDGSMCGREEDYMNVMRWRSNVIGARVGGAWRDAAAVVGVVTPAAMLLARSHRLLSLSGGWLVGEGLQLASVDMGTLLRIGVWAAVLIALLAAWRIVAASLAWAGVLIEGYSLASLAGPVAGYTLWLLVLAVIAAVAVSISTDIRRAYAVIGARRCVVLIVSAGLVVMTVAAAQARFTQPALRASWSWPRLTSLLSDEPFLSQSPLLLSSDPRIRLDGFFFGASPATYLVGLVGAFTLLHGLNARLQSRITVMLTPVVSSFVAARIILHRFVSASLGLMPVSPVRSGPSWARPAAWTLVATAPIAALLVGWVIMHRRERLSTRYDTHTMADDRTSANDSGREVDIVVIDRSS
jgi:hypothetical protein